MAEEPEKVSSSAALQQPPSSSSGEVAVFKPQVCLNPGPYDEQTNRGAGIYAVSVHHHQFGAPLPSNYLIPLTYNIPTARPSNESEAGGDSRSPFSLIYSLYLKLAAVIFLFNQDGSRQRRAVLVIFATIIYLCRGTRECGCSSGTRESMVGNSERDSDGSFRFHNFTSPWLPQHRLDSLFTLCSLIVFNKKTLFIVTADDLTSSSNANACNDLASSIYLPRTNLFYLCVLI
ncbi:hypothetical protein DY000_02027590 [Brassica cretica]|uniref:Uncharacterized protein n=1 Tax=Brassica cretica TaxID=69181 RepID=A0ABQ7EJW6_BRACR|nr:hypothetical protein DY000_02027590 [Brassica cretica]